MSSARKTSLAIAAALALAIAAVGFSACGYSSTSKDVVEGQPVKLGNVQYEVVYSRYLNASDAEDSAYLVGQPPAPNGSTYFGVFFEAENKADAPQALPKSFEITDTDHNVYRSIPSRSLYAFPLGGEVEAEEQVPELDSTAQQGSIGGSLVLFQLPAAASESRPLTLSIPGPEGPGKVTLDL